MCVCIESSRAEGNSGKTPMFSPKVKRSALHSVNKRSESTIPCIIVRLSAKTSASLFDYLLSKVDMRLTVTVIPRPAKMICDFKNISLRDEKIAPLVTIRS